jgi:flagellar protein FlbD
MESADGSGRVIRVHRLNDVEVVVNAELIESVESHGAETVLALVTGNKIVVRESVTDVIQKTIEYKKTVFAGAAYLPEFLKGDKRFSNTL